MASGIVRRHEYGLTVSVETFQWLLRNEMAIKVVRVIEISSMSTLELLEFGLSKQDIMFAFVNGLIEIDINYINADPDPSIVSKIVDGKYDYWNSRKFVLSRLGLLLLDTLKGSSAV